MHKVTVSILLVFLLASCKDLGEVGPSSNSAFAIHLLRDSTITMFQAYGQNVNHLPLRPTPWLSANDIDFYDFSSHCIYLKQDKRVFFPTLGKGGVFPFSWWCKPFVVVAEGQPRYLGLFNSGLSSDDWPAPLIQDLGIYPEDVLNIEWHWVRSINIDEDPRTDPTTKRALQQAALYHAGVAITLDAAHLVQNSDSAAVSYSFTITNNDVEVLYLIDPDLMGDGLFNYFNNGPQIMPSTDFSTVYRTDRSGAIHPAPFDSWSPEWFVKIPSGASIRRVVNVPGYPHIPSGNYIAMFWYSGPVNIDKAQRLLPDGRRWIGPTRSSVYALTVD